MSKLGKVGNMHQKVSVVVTMLRLGISVFPFPYFPNFQEIIYINGSKIALLRKFPGVQWLGLST